MAKVRVLNRKLKGFNDPQLKDCFLQLTGEKDPPEHVVREKNGKLRIALKTLSKTLELLSQDDDWRDLFDQDEEFETMHKFSKRIIEVMGSGDNEMSYKELKDSETVYKCATLFLKLGKLAGRHLEKTDESIPRDQFVRESKGELISILDPVCNLKIYPSRWYDYPTEARGAFLDLLKKILKISGHVRHVLVTPDADVDDMVDAIIKALELLEKRKPRCKNVFRKIREAADMLRDNFDGYYERFLRSGHNSTVICTSFLDDIVSQHKGKMSVSLLWEFKELKKLLVGECKRAGMSSNPMAKKLLKIMDDTLDAAGQEAQG